MSGIMCVWANLPEQALDWYENEYLPETTALHSKHTLYCEIIENGFGTDPIGHLDAPWRLMALYDIEDISKMTQDALNKQNHPPGRVAETARFDLKTYRELYKWGDEDFDGDIKKIASVTVMEWQIPTELEEEVLEFYIKVIGPLVAESEDVLRLRLYKANSAAVLEGDTFIMKEKDAQRTYFVMVEFGSEEWPWDTVMQLSELDQWRKYFESQEIVKWQTSHYIVQRRYPVSQHDALNTNEGDSRAGT